MLAGSLVGLEVPFDVYPLVGLEVDNDGVGYVPYPLVGLEDIDGACVSDIDGSCDAWTEAVEATSAKTRITFIANGVSVSWS